MNDPVELLGPPKLPLKSLCAMAIFGVVMGWDWQSILAADIGVFLAYMLGWHACEMAYLKQQYERRYEARKPRERKQLQYDIREDRDSLQ